MSFRGKNVIGWHASMEMFDFWSSAYWSLFISRCQSIDNDFACQARASAPPGRLFYCKHVHFNMQRFDEK